MAHGQGLRTARQWTDSEQKVLDDILRFRGGHLLASAATRTARVQSEEAAYDMQDWLARKLGHKVAGWKVGAYFNPSVREALGLTRPFYGRIFAPQLHRSPAILPQAMHPGCHIETELAFEIGADIPLEGDCLNVDTLSERIIACRPAYEVVTSTWDNRKVLSGSDHIADNGGCAGLVISEPLPEWRSIKLQGLPLVLRVDDKTVFDGVVELDWNHLLNAAVWLINHLKHRGIALYDGDIIATGTLTGLTPLCPGEEAVAQAGSLFEVKVALTR